MAALEGPGVKTALEAESQAEAGILDGLGDLKASPITWSSKMWSTFQGLGPRTWLLSPGFRMSLESGFEVANEVNEADLSSVPVET